MYEIPNGYPGSCKSKTLAKIVKDLSEALTKMGLEKSSALPDINRRAQLSSLIQLGLGELQGRKNRNISYFSGFLSLVSLSVAFTALTVSENTSKSSVRWESRQIELLEKIDESISNTRSKETVEINDGLKKLFKELNSFEQKMVTELNEIQTANKTN